MRIQACALHSPERQKNRMSTSEMIEGQRQEYTENRLTADPKKIPAAVCEIIIDRNDYSLVQVLLFACSVATTTSMCLCWSLKWFVLLALNAR